MDALNAPVRIRFRNLSRDVTACHAPDFSSQEKQTQATSKSTYLHTIQTSPHVHWRPLEIAGDSGDFWISLDSGVPGSIWWYLTIVRFSPSSRTGVIEVIGKR
eukprot:1383735-Amorphochlora_amoeboformis.AAC.1